MFKIPSIGRKRFSLPEGPCQGHPYGEGLLGRIPWDNHKNLNILLFSLLIVCLFSCTKESENQGEFQQYLDRFKFEGSLRGIIVDYDKIPVHIDLEVYENQINLGWCTYRSREPNVVTINEFYWAVLSSNDKERLIFHELGHCVLGRPHLEQLRSDGYCKSIMNSGQTCADNYSVETRAVYLDELFLRK